MTTSILLTVWGNPFEWREAEYILSSRRYRARTTLNSFIEDVDYVLLVVPDSLASADGRECKPRIFNNSWRPSRYSDIIERAEKLAREWIIECGSLGEDLEKIYFRVAPNTGTYNWLSLYPGRATPFDIYGSYLLYYTTSALLELSPGDLVVKVDLTHGINYMPVLLGELALVVAAIYTLAGGGKVRLEVYNSEPYPRRVKQIEPILKIHRVVEYTLDEKRAAILLLDQIARLGRRESIKVVELSRDREILETAIEYRKTANKLYREALVGVGIYLSSAPLAAAYYSIKEWRNKKTKEIINMMKRVYCSDIEELVDYRVEGERIVIEWKYPPLLYDTLALLSASAIADYVAQIGRKHLVEKLEQEGLELEYLERILEELEGSIKWISKRELDNIREGCLREKQDVKCFLKEEDEEIPSEWIDRECIYSSIDSRNMYAHAGLEKNTVEIRRNRDKLWIRYRKNCWRYIAEKMRKDICREILGLRK